MVTGQIESCSWVDLGYLQCQCPVNTDCDRPSVWLLPRPTVPGNRPRSVISPPLRIFGVVLMGRVDPSQPLSAQPEVTGTGRSGLLP